MNYQEDMFQFILMPILVHGKLRRNPFGIGLREVDHAWVEEGNEIFDLCMDIRLPKKVYEDLFEVVVYKKYTHDEVNRITLKIQHWGPWEDIKEVMGESVDKAHEKAALHAIRYVWRLMPEQEKFYEYNFSIWMNNDKQTHDFVLALARRLYPTDSDAIYTFFEKDIIPTLEKLEMIRNKQREKKIGSDPLFLLKQSVKNKSWEGAKQSLMHVSPALWAYKGGRITDEEAERMFNRLYKIALGQTMYDEKYIGNAPKLSDLSTNHNNTHETLFIHHLAGWNAQKFPDVVKVYRGTNSPLAKIRPGDFVTFDKDYARTYTRSKFGTVQQDILPSKDLRVFAMQAERDELVYWPEGHQIKQVENIPTFREFWEKRR